MLAVRTPRRAAPRFDGGGLFGGLGADLVTGQGGDDRLVRDGGSDGPAEAPATTRSWRLTGRPTSSTAAPATTSPTSTAATR
ncbi:MAG: hypothetical protein QOJ63_2090 [Solirubrobacteraceae bacterium]|nr:hypothetical protein [Solirubrobacteraceae bacterium]